MASIFPTAIALVERRTHLDSKTTRWFFVGASIGGMTLPWLAGNLFEHIGPQAAMLAILADFLIATAILMATLRCSAQMDKNSLLAIEP
jgi:fucose permease